MTSMTTSQPAGYENTGQWDEPYHDPNTLRQLYVERRLTTREVGERFGVDRQTIARWLERHGIERRGGLGWRRRYATYNVDKYGYPIWRAGNGESEVQRLRVHRLLAVSEFGFDAVEDKVVHHKNGIKWDNRPDNIELFDEHEHNRLHARKQNTGYRSETTLRRLYHREKRSQHEIADQFGIHHSTVQRWMDKYGIERRSLSQARRLEGGSA